MEMMAVAEEDDPLITTLFEPQAKKCKLQILIESLSEKRRVAVEHAMNSFYDGEYEWPALRLANTLSDNKTGLGVKVTQSAVLRHRKHECACG